MSVAVDNSTTRIIDPVFDRANFRAEFKLPAQSVFQANLRLLNVGISSTGADSYAMTCGALGAINSIQLYDGAQMLDQITDFSTYASWFNLNKTNETNMSVRRHLDYNALGFIQQGTVTESAGPNVPGQFSRGDMVFKTQNPVADQIPAGGTPKTAWVDLRSMLPFLRSSMVLPTSLFTQFRIVVQFKSQGGLSHIVQADRTATLLTQVGTVLVAEEIEDGPLKEQMMSQYAGVRFEPVEFDQVSLEPIVTAATNPSTQLIAVPSDFLMHGFSNKYLRKVLIIKTPTDSTTWVDGVKNQGYGSLGSSALWNETLQIRVNGVNKLAGSGVEGKNRRLAMVTDAFGDINLIPGQQLTGSELWANYVDGTADGLIETEAQVDYGGMTIEEYVDTFQVFLNRTGVDLNPYLNQRIDLKVMGIVKKSVLLDGSGRGYSVVYDQA